MDLFGKRHAGNLRGWTWTMEGFKTYFGQEGKSKGNSAEFQAVVQALAGLDQAAAGPETKEAHQARLEAGDKLMQACQAYSASHKKAMSAKGRERLAVVDKLVEFQLGQELKDADKLKSREWDLKSLGDYFRDHEALKSSSPGFKAAAQAFEEFVGQQDKVITPESAVAMIKSSEKLKKACQTFSASMAGTMLASEVEHQAFMDGLSKFHEDLNLDQARDRRILKSYEGKTWGEVGKFKMAEIVLDGKDVDIMGASVSQRMKVDYEGKKGFFTERLEVKSREGYVRDLIEAVDRNEDPGLRRVLEEYEGKLNEHITVLKGLEKEKKAMQCSIVEHWDQMEEGIGSKKESLGRALISDRGKLAKAADVVAAFQAQVKPEMGADQKSGLMEKAIREGLGKNDQDLKKLLSKNKDLLMGVPVPDLSISEEAYNDRYFKLGLIQLKAADPNARPLDRLIEDSAAVHRFVDVLRVAESASTARLNANFELDAGNELTSRNIASSRMAELLGIGDIIAHSEPMKVKKDGKVLTGCFMEFAKGVDSSSTRQRDLQALAEAEILDSPGLNRDSSTLEVFDFLCGQSDRHTGNMFYRLSQPDKDGKRTVTGLQGIDNDLAFGEQAEIFLYGMNGSWRDMVFIDKGLAEKVQSLDRDTLEYAVGDLISQKQIDVLMDRVSMFKDHMEKNMVIIEPDKWDLKKYKPKECLNDRDKRYLEGLEAMDTSIKAKAIFDSGLRHKVGQVSLVQQSAKALRQRSKVAMSFKDLESKERRQGLRREPKMTIGKDREVKKDGPQLL